MHIPVTGKTMRHKFVESIPSKLEPEVLFVSLEHDTAVHLCACGCGIEVVTPLSPAEWSVTYDGRSISLHPSIGNWGFPCRSHYWVRKGKVEWAPQWSDEEIAAVRVEDQRDKFKLYEQQQGTRIKVAQVPLQQERVPLLRRLLRAILG
jgi:hypothetical protein